MPSTPPCEALPATTLMPHAVQQLQHGLVTPAQPCKVCDGEATLYDVLDFDKTCTPPPTAAAPACGVPVYYRRCTRCAFIGTDFFDRFTPQQWVGHVYNDAYYATVDPEYAEVRPRGNAAAVDALLCDRRDAWHGLDYGGGNGATAARLRAMGYRYECADPFGSSTVGDEARGRFDFCSVFEVAEHTPDPKGFMADLVGWCSPGRLAVLVGTHVHDAAVTDAQRLAWWYAAPRNGHVSLHSRRSLALLAGQFGLECLSFTEQTHLLTRGYTRSEARRFLLKGKIRGRLRRLLRTERA